MLPLIDLHDMPPRVTRRAMLSASLILLAGERLAWAQDASKAEKPSVRLDVPYVPTPQEVVDAMLNMADVKKNDVVYDLGCGDGRIVITAAKERGARGVGIDIDPQRIKEARRNATEAGVSDQLQFKVADLFRTDVSPASVVTLYLLPEVNRKLRPRLWRQLKVGTRVVSHAFDMGDEWPPQRTEQVAGATIYFWTIGPQHKRGA